MSSELPKWAEMPPEIIEAERKKREEEERRRHEEQPEVPLSDPAEEEEKKDKTPIGDEPSEDDKKEGPDKVKRGILIIDPDEEDIGKGFEI